MSPLLACNIPSERKYMNSSEESSTVRQFTKCTPLVDSPAHMACRIEHPPKKDAHMPQTNPWAPKVGPIYFSHSSPHITHARRVKKCEPSHTCTTHASGTDRRKDLTVGRCVDVLAFFFPGQWAVATTWVRPYCGKAGRCSSEHTKHQPTKSWFDRRHTAIGPHRPRTSGAG